MKLDSILIDVPAIFSWSAILGYLDRDPNEIAYRFKGQTIYRTFLIHQQIYLIKINYLKKAASITSSMVAAGRNYFIVYKERNRKGATILKLQRKWGRWSAYATFYIWRDLY